MNPINCCPSVLSADHLGLGNHTQSLFLRKTLPRWLLTMYNFSSRDGALWTFPLSLLACQQVWSHADPMQVILMRVHNAVSCRHVQKTHSSSPPSPGSWHFLSLKCRSCNICIPFEAEHSLPPILSIVTHNCDQLGSSVTSACCKNAASLVKDKTGTYKYLERGWKL